MNVEKIYQACKKKHLGKKEMPKEQFSACLK
jgi:hypothetical protein